MGACFSSQFDKTGKTYETSNIKVFREGIAAQRGACNLYKGSGNEAVRSAAIRRSKALDERVRQVLRIRFIMKGPAFEQLPKDLIARFLDVDDRSAVELSEVERSAVERSAVECNMKVKSIGSA